MLTAECVSFVEKLLLGVPADLDIDRICAYYEYVK